jgi:diguanylate cyclase (GGDEF)-like protein
LPTGQLIEEQLRRIIHAEGWSYVDIRIKNFDVFNDMYGFVAGDNVIKFLALLLNEVVNELGTSDDFLGHPGGSNFIIITTQEAAPAIIQRSKERFEKEVLSHYSFIDRGQGYIVTKGPGGQDRKVDLMTLSAGAVSSSQFEYADIREITERAAEARRLSE